MIIPIVVAFAARLVGWVYQALKPPPPKICGLPNGPPLTSCRVKLNDGRHLAYREFGVPKEKAQHKIILSHGYNDNRHMHLAASQELMEELDACIILYDRAGYGKSDPYPSRSAKTEAFDIEELADKLELGNKFYMFFGSVPDLELSEIHSTQTPGSFLDSSFRELLVTFHSTGFSKTII
ncbi:hypothetical protein SDJN03_19584, partial [Cucurbita argyrosperma subsp. sororia]